MKKKLALHVAALRVEQFQVGPAFGGARGTVQGRSQYTDGDTACCGSNAASDPCRLCPNMPITYSCEGNC